MKRNTFIEFYLDIEGEDSDYIDEYLRERGIDIQKASEEMLARVRKNSAAQRIEEGKRFAESWSRLVSTPKKMKEIKSEMEKDNSPSPELRLAFRKLEQMAPGDIEDILSTQEKLAILEYLKTHNL